MAVTSFKPEIWSRVILAAEKKALVFGGMGISNEDYEGEISGPGNTVHITQFGDPEINDYAGSITYQQLDDAEQQLLISQKKYFAFEIDDVDKRQAAGDMQAYLEDRASYQLANTADQYLASFYTYAGNVLTGNDGTNPSTNTTNYVEPGTFTTSAPADFYLKVILPLQVQLDQSLVPANNRYVVVPPWAEALLRETQAFVSYGTTSAGGAGEVFTEGLLGRVAGFDVYKSMNSVEYDTGNGGYIVQAGHPMALTFASQIVQVEALRLQTSFSDAVRGLNVYGAKLVRPDHIAIAGVKRPAGI